MRLLQLSDLHLGKRVNEFPMLEDQKYILEEILHIAEKEKPDGILIAGDIYDRPTPGEDAVRLLDYFLGRLAMQKQQVYIISGNHDSAVKLSFASELIERSGIHIAPVYDGTMKSYVLGEGAEKIHIYLLPFVKPAVVRAIFPEEKIESYTDAVRVALAQTKISGKEYNVLVAHQFVTGAQRSESEEIHAGGLDNVDAEVFRQFDYVALGHIHGAQHTGSETIRYCGTPLKYSFSECSQTKSITAIDITYKNGEKRTEIRTIPLHPLRDLRKLRGTYAELTDKKNYEGTAREDYLQITLTDEEDVPDAMAKLRIIYPNLMLLRYDNTRTRECREITEAEELEKKTPMSLFEELYVLQNNQPMNEEQRKLVEKLIGKIWEEESL